MAIVHFTGPPAIGGIESLMARQCAVLARLGHQAVCVVGKGRGVEGVELVQIPLIDPANGDVTVSRHALGDVPPTHDHPLVRELLARLESALGGCTDCWIHNALTVSLNPFLTCALHALIRRRPEIGWVTWCADISSTSRFVHSQVGDPGEVPADVSNRLTWVAISETRRAELGTALGIPSHRIQVVHPPLDVVDWLDVGTEAQSVIAATRLLESDLIVLVPAKALPHKCLDRAVRVGSLLARQIPSVRMIVTAASSAHEPTLSLLVRDRLRRAIRDARVEDGVRLLPDLLGRDPTDRTVGELMQLCDVVFLPSAEEGFGMPLLEAAACRAPVVCTDIPVFREVAHDSALYFREEWNDERVASLITTTAGASGHPQRRSVRTSMRRFESDLEDLLRLSTHPKV